MTTPLTTTSTTTRRPRRAAAAEPFPASVRAALVGDETAVRHLYGLAAGWAKQLARTYYSVEPADVVAAMWETLVDEPATLDEWRDRTKALLRHRSGARRGRLDVVNDDDLLARWPTSGRHDGWADVDERLDAALQLSRLDIPRSLHTNCARAMRDERAVSSRTFRRYTARVRTELAAA